MADFTALKTAIQNAIKQNGNEEITGNLLQDVLLAMVTTLGDGSINDLITALDSEATARQQADGTLQQNIAAEAQTRNQADTTLQQNIDAEATARQQGDTQLNDLITGIKNNIDNGYVYAGVATPSTEPVSGKVFYLAVTAGTYTNFGNAVVTAGINVIKYNGSAWSVEQVIAIDADPTQGSDHLANSGGVARTKRFLEELIGNNASQLGIYEKEDIPSDNYGTLITPFVFKKGVAYDLVYETEQPIGSLFLANTPTTDASQSLKTIAWSGETSVETTFTYNDDTPALYLCQITPVANRAKQNISVSIKEHDGTLDEKLGVIDTDVQSDSKNLITSGGVFNAMSKLENGKSYNLSSLTPITGSINGGTGKWTANVGQSIIIPCIGGETLYVKANDTYFTSVSFLQNNTLADDTVPSYAGGYTTRLKIDAGTDIYIRIPDDCRFLLIYKNYQTTVYQPDTFNIVLPYNVSSKNVVGKAFNLVGSSTIAGGQGTYYGHPEEDALLLTPQLTKILQTNSRNYGVGGSTICINPDAPVKSAVERICGLNGETEMPDADIWMLYMGVNDIIYNSTLGSMSSTISDTDTVYGALKAIATNLCRRSNSPIIIFCMQQWCMTIGMNETKASQIAQAIKDVAEKYNIPFLDVSKVCGMNGNNWNELNYGYDQTHMRPIGVDRCKYKVANFILENI